MKNLTIKYPGCFANWQVISTLLSSLHFTRYPIHIGLGKGIIRPLEPHGLPPDVETIADILLAANYSTHAVGRFLLDFLLMFLLEIVVCCR